LTVSFSLPITEPVRVYRVAVAGVAAKGNTREPPLPSKPSITVLPFRNLSGDPAQQYFSDGITEDIITELSRFRSLSVVAHHSFFASRDQRLDSPDVAQRLGVHYVVEGSVRRFGDTVRITARLSDAGSGSKLWADHYIRTESLESADAAWRHPSIRAPGFRPSAHRSTPARTKPPASPMAGSLTGY
jgi:TolB-like protein